MVFSLIRQNYKYVDSTGEAVADATIPTLYEWMDMFAANTALKLIILDLKIVDIDLADYLVGHIMTKAVSLGVDSKVQLVSSDYSMAAALQTSLSRAGYPINRVGQINIYQHRLILLNCVVSRCQEYGEALPELFILAPMKTLML